jgi:hypothetical protein
MHGRATQRDFATYYLTARATDANENPYTTDFGPSIRRFGYDTGGVTHATDPPTFLILLRPLGYLPIDQAFWCWTAFNALCLAVSVFLLLGSGPASCYRAVLVLTSLVVLYQPVILHFLDGQSKLPVLLLLVLVMRFTERRWDGAAGIALAAAILLRVFPAALLGYFVLKRRWIVIGYTFAALGIGGLLTVILLGPGVTISFANGISTLTQSHWTRMPVDISLNGFISRAFWFFFGTNLTARMDFIRKSSIVLVDLIITSVAVRSTLARSQGDDPDWRAFSLWVATSVMLSPIAWDYYQVLFLLVFAQMAQATMGARCSRRAIMAAVANFVLTFVWIPIGGFTVLAQDIQQYLLSEIGSLSLIVGYISAYWFATDHLCALDPPRHSSLSPAALAQAPQDSRAKRAECMVQCDSGRDD